MKNMTRREFIVNGSILMGGTVGTIAMGKDLLTPQTANAEKAKFLESNCGSGDKKVLVAYASYCGSTGSVAEAVAQVLCKNGANVDVRLVKSVNDLSPYKAAVIGSAVRSSSWWPEAIEFVKTNQYALSRMPVAYFLTCLALYKDSEKSRHTAKTYMEPALKAAPKIQPVGTGLFAGALDYSKLNLMYRIVMKSKMKKLGVPEGDFRNWDAIRSWAEDIGSSLLAV